MAVKCDRTGGRVRVKESVEEGAVDRILSASDRLISSTGDSGEMVRQARILAQATAQLIQAIKVSLELHGCKNLVPLVPTLQNWTDQGEGGMETMV